MKKILLLLLALLPATFFAQQSGSVTLDWVDNKPFPSGPRNVRIPYIKSSKFSYDSGSGRVFYQFVVPQSAMVGANALQLTNVVYESLTQAQLGELKASALPQSVEAKIEGVKSRDRYSAVITLNLIIKEGGGFKRVKSFSYNINATAARTALPQNVSAVTGSVLASGDWYRFYVEKSGVYRISRNFLQSLGMDTSVDPRKIKIYGNGGRMLPLGNATPAPIDLTENAIQLIGETDGAFNDDDYILFYAEGVDNWNDESFTKNNLYADRSYYYVTAGGAADGKRIGNMPSLEGSPDPVTNITVFDDMQIHEEDLVNPSRLGRRWFGEQFDVFSEQTFSFSLPNIVTTSPATVTVFAGSASFVPTSLTVQANNQTVGTLPMSALAGNLSLVQAVLNNGNIPNPTADINIKLTFNNGGAPNSRGYLDYIILRAQRNLTGYGKQFRFRYDAAATQTGVGQYMFNNASGISQVWDITDIFNVAKAENPGQSNFSFKAQLGEVRQYIAIDPSDYYAPLKESQSRVANQDLKGTIFNNAQGQFQDIDYLIVAPAAYVNQAEKLANFHRTYSQLNVKVVALETIYQEFSSGKQDIAAIRNFVKYVYDNAAVNKVKYLNLFGDASFDYKNRIPDNTNVTPIYHALVGSGGGGGIDVNEFTYCSDTWFTLMDANEGLPNSTMYTGGDIAVGRMLFDSGKQAEEMVDKVIEYHDLKSYGSWRNNLVFIADDADQESDASLQVRMNAMADEITGQKPFFNPKKIILDAYIQETAAGGNRYPKAREDFFNAFEKGALVLNYLGHGGEDGLTQERVWEKVDSQNLQNAFKYPLFITVTCEFTKFDNPYRPTAGEDTYWNPRGGAVAMITTVRSIFQGAAENFNDHLSQYIFNYGDGAGPQTSIAEALRLAKATGGGLSPNVALYIGDPALFLAIPKPKIVLTEVNDMPVSGPIDDFKSLAFMKIEGVVTDEFDVPLTTYNGELAINIFDKPLTRTTLNNDGNASPMPFSTLGETIFRGNASIANGQFEVGFVVPRDIRIPVGNGRISFYAKRNEILLDKTGYDTTIKIGGINENAAADETAPTVKLYMNDLTFVSGGITSESPIFLAYLEDEHGINTASGIGHDIVAVLDGDESNPHILNDYYETELDDFTKGKVQFPFRDLEKGLHTITFIAWDVYNNRITSEIQFVVVGDETLTLSNVLNYPNPFSTYTQFWFTHNRPFEPLEVQVQVITVTGKVVWTKNQTVTTDGFLSREITWDGRDDFGDRIGKGVYVYRLTVRSTVTGTKSEKYEKLVIL
jgi:hypothetical protein